MSDARLTDAAYRVSEHRVAKMIEHLEAVNGSLGTELSIDTMFALRELQAARQQLAEAEAREQALREALAFYADASRYDDTEQCGSEACLDAGCIARAAVAPASGSDGQREAGGEVGRDE